jgi:hypothetical protein
VAAEPARPDVLLILDDYHLISSDSVHAPVRFLLEHRPPQATSVSLRTRQPNCSGRSRPICCRPGWKRTQAGLGAWTDFVRRVVTGFGAGLAAIQVTGEANLAGIPDAGDGAYPGAVEALVHGLSAAAAAKRERALDVPSASPWSRNQNPPRAPSGQAGLRAAPPDLRRAPLRLAREP